MCHDVNSSVAYDSSVTPWRRHIHDLSPDSGSYRVMVFRYAVTASGAHTPMIPTIQITL